MREVHLFHCMNNALKILERFDDIAKHLNFDNESDRKVALIKWPIWNYNFNLK